MSKLKVVRPEIIQFCTDSVEYVIADLIWTPFLRLEFDI